MELLSLEVFDLATSSNPNPTTSKYAVLDDDASITITETSEILADGDVWSMSFSLNVHANAHIFGTSGEIHGGRLHDQIHKRRARLWVEGIPLYLGYLLLEDETDVDETGNVDVKFESGQKTFSAQIEGANAQEVSVGDVVIGVALNRKRVSNIDIPIGDGSAAFHAVSFTLDGLEGYAEKEEELQEAYKATYSYGPRSYSKSTSHVTGNFPGKTPYVQRWPKLVKSCGKVFDSEWSEVNIDFTNVQTAYDDSHPFCNINICYPLKVKNDEGEEVAARGYTVRLAHGKDTTDGGDDQTRFNNAPNFYLLYFIDRLFSDLGIVIEENQAKDVEDLRRVFMLNYGCHYEEIEDEYDESESSELTSHATPSGFTSRYGQYYIQIGSPDDKACLVKGQNSSGQYVSTTEKRGLDHPGKVLLRDVTITKNGNTLLEAGSLEGFVQGAWYYLDRFGYFQNKSLLSIDRTADEKERMAYSAYLAYATGENYPDVEISEIVTAMETMFGIRFLFSRDYRRVRIVLLRNVFRSDQVQDIACDILGGGTKTESSIRGFRMTYGKGADDTNYYYKGFNDMFPRASATWKDTSDKHNYSLWKLDALYVEIKQQVSAMNKRCYVTPVNGNAYGVKVDEDEDVLFPTLLSYADFIDAEDGDCTGESETIKEVQCGASPVIMNNVNGTYASLFGGDLKAPAPDIVGTDDDEIDKCWENVGWIATYGRMTTESVSVRYTIGDLVLQGRLDVYLAEGFRIRLEDNYGVSNVGTPFDEETPGLQFGIMRSSGSDAYIFAANDELEDEGNDYWEQRPGSGAISHPDTCDEYGNQWDYNGAGSYTAAEAEAKIRALCPGTADSILLERSATREALRAAGWAVGSTSGSVDHYYHSFTYRSETDGSFTIYCTPIKHPNGEVFTRSELESYVTGLLNHYGWRWFLYPQVTMVDTFRCILAVATTEWSQISNLRMIYFGGTADEYCDNGLGATSGRFSLKLRAEKPNPYYNPDSGDNGASNQYLAITGPGLRQRGLADQFYKEYSYFIRNARIVSIPVRMTLAQLLRIDRTTRVKVGDVRGFIRKMQYSVSKKTGLGKVTMEIMYI